MSKSNRTFFPLQLGLTALCCLFMVVPVVQSMLAGVSVNFFHGISSGFTTRWLVEMWDLYAGTIFRSMYIAFLCLGVCLAVGTPAAYGLARRQDKWSRFIQELLVLPLAIPGLAIAMGILLVYGGFTEFRSSVGIILAGHVIFCLPFMVRAVTAVLAMLNLKELEESAASLGANSWQCFRDVILPCALPGMLAGSLMVFTLSVGEFNLTWMLHTPLTKTLPVGLADSYASMRLEIGSAYTLAFFCIIIPVLCIMQAMMRTHQSRAGASLPADAIKEFRHMEQVSIKAAAKQFRGVSVELKGCAKTFPDGTQALEPMDLAMPAGETLVFLGPSGCGKTTTLRIIAGLEEPDTGGMVLFGDEDVTRVPIEKRNVGMVFQNYALFPNMNVLDNVAYGLKIRGYGKDERRTRAMEMLEMMRIGELALRQVTHISGGQRQRVALARALAVRPKVLLLDEPLTALDAKLRDELRVEIQVLLRSLGVTAVYVTHDQSEAMALGDRIAVMENGRIAQIGRPRDIYFRPATAFVADFIGVFNKLSVTADGDGMALAGTPIPDACVHASASRAAGDMEVFVRPEDVRLAANEAGNDWSGVPGVVESALFLGDKVRVVVRLADGQTLQADAPGKEHHAAGAPVSISLRAEAVTVLEC